MSLFTIVSFSIVAVCLMAIAYMIGEMVGSKKTTEKLQRFLQAYYYIRPLSQMGKINSSNPVPTPTKSKPHLFVLKNDDVKQK